MNSAHAVDRLRHQKVLVKTALRSAGVRESDSPFVDLTDCGLRGQIEIPMNNLPKDIAQLVNNLCREGDRFAGIDQFLDAIDKYQAAWSLLPAPPQQWPAATWILLSIGDAYYWQADFHSGARFLLEAATCPEGDSNPYLCLRLGQCLFEVGRLDEAANALEAALRGGGHELFEGEDTKYLQFVKTQQCIMSITPTARRFNRPLP